MAALVDGLQFGPQRRFEAVCIMVSLDHFRTQWHAGRAIGMKTQSLAYVENRCTVCHGETL